MRKVVSGLALLAAVGGSALFVGTAQADVGVGGNGGNAINNCLNLGLNLIGGIGLAGQGVQAGGVCAAGANGGNGFG